MNLRSILFIVTISALAFASCQKKEEEVVTPGSVQIALSSPSATDTYKKGDSVTISGNVSYTTELHGYTIEIKDEKGNVVFDTDEHVHTDKFAFSEKWADTMSTTETLTLTFTAEIDHNGNESKKTVSFKTHP